MIIVSLLINLLLLVLILYWYLQRPEPIFYATNGITPPILLQPLNGANELANPLLPPDPVIPAQVKTIPE